MFSVFNFIGVYRTQELFLVTFVKAFPKSSESTYNYTIYNIIGPSHMYVLGFTTDLQLCGLYF